MKIEKLFLRLAIPFLLISIFVMPVTKVPDEATHAFMSWNILFDSPIFRDKISFAHIQILLKFKFGFL